MRIRLRRLDDAEWAHGSVALASRVSETQRQSVAVSLEDAVRQGSGVVIGVLPLHVDYAAARVIGLAGDEYEIEYAPGSK